MKKTYLCRWTSDI